MPEFPAGDVKRERRGVRYVQALDRAGQVDARDVIADFLGELAQAFAFGAEHQRERCAQGQGGEVAVAARIEADNQEAALLERRERDSAR